MNIKDIQIKDFNYPLPDERIAKHPLTQREQCKLLVYQNGDIQDLHFYDVPRLLPQQSMLVYNNTRVINARLRFQKPNAGAIIEIFCLEPIAPRDYAQVFQTTNQCSWLCFVGNSKRWKAGSLTQVVNVNGCEVELAATRGEQKGNAFEIIFQPILRFLRIISPLGLLVLNMNNLMFLPYHRYFPWYKQTH